MTLRTPYVLKDEEKFPEVTLTGAPVEEMKSDDKAKEEMKSDDKATELKPENTS